MKEERVNANIEGQLSEQGVYVSTTVGWSMWPMLRNRRDRIVVMPVGDQPLKKHDLPLYKRPDGKYILHRILEVKDGHYVIRGDNTFQREYVPYEWVLGYVSEFYRKDRHINSNSKAYRFYVVIWRLIYPARWMWHFALRVARKLRRMIGGKR